MKIGQRWFRFRLRRKGILRAILAGMVLLVLAKALGGVYLPGMSGRVMPGIGEMAKAAVQDILGNIWQQAYPSPDFSGRQEGAFGGERDPSYRAFREVETFFREHEYLEIYGNEETWETGRDGILFAGEGGEGADKAAEGADKASEGADKAAEGADKASEGADKAAEEADKAPEEADKAEGNGNGAAKPDTGQGEEGGGVLPSEGTEGEDIRESEDAGEAALARVSFPGQTYRLAQLKDYDFLMSHFYNVHTSTTADRQLMDAQKLLQKDFGLYPEGGGQQEGPQILIYHTHSQEAFSGSGEGEGIVDVGTYLAQLLEGRGFSVYHDCSVYDVRDGKLDRNRAYTYALEGISKILEDNPSIQVVIDLHRDGVKEGVRLVTEVNGKPTAQIMFFNGLSQTPDGPVPYLENPYREDNLAFSLQLQLKAAAYYPGFARKIYLKGLRYNQHVRPCSCLIEAGAQTNTYEEARNAMEPLAEVLTMLLRGN